MKTKKKTKKTLEKMNKETKRAMAHVDFLSKLYQEMKKAEKVS